MEDSSVSSVSGGCCASPLPHHHSLHKGLNRLRQHGLDGKAAPSHHSSYRRASVLVLLSNDYRILLTQRSAHLRSHPGEVCFPGGKQDEADDGDDWKTATRETQEEVGLELEQQQTILPMEKIARLRTVVSINHLCVTPLVGFVDLSSSELDQHIQINPSEVQHFFWVPLDYFVTVQPDQENDIPWQGEVFVFRKYLFPLDAEGGRPSRGVIPITGLTAHVARQVAEIAWSSELASTTTTSSGVPTRTPRTVPGGPEYRGLLWRQQQQENGNRSLSSSSSSSWVRLYFVLSGGMLHQYDNQHVANRKSHRASKKNRLRLRNDDTVQITMLPPPTGDATTTEAEPLFLFPFQVSVLEGRVVWHLAAPSDQERSHWKRLILDSI